MKEEATSNSEITDFLKEFGEEMEIAIEASPIWYWLYDNLEGEGFDVKLSHPLKTKAIAYAKVKTDKVYDPNWEDNRRFTPARR